MAERVGLLEIEQEVHDVAVVVRAGGEVDSGTVETLAAALDSAVADAAAHPARTVVVDLDGITYFGSAGLNALLTCREQGEGRGVAMRLVATTAEVTRPIEVTRLARILRPYPSVGEAVAAPEDPR